MLTTTKKGVTLIRYNIQLHLLFDDWLITSIFFFPPQLWRLGCMFPGPTQQIVFFSLKFMHIKMPIKYWPHDLRKWITCTNSFPSPWFPFHFKFVTWPWFWVGVDFNMLACEQKSWMRLSDLITYFLKAETMGLIHVLRSRGFPKILWDTWQTSYSLVFQNIVSTKLGCVETFLLNGYLFKG